MPSDFIANVAKPFRSILSPVNPLTIKRAPHSNPVGRAAVVVSVAAVVVTAGVVVSGAIVEIPMIKEVMTVGIEIQNIIFREPLICNHWLSLYD